jgi:CTP:molybdopterin cytidylyltransferase MocA
MTLSSMLKKRSTGEAGELINSSDIPDGTKTVTIVIAAIRESPEDFNAPAIIDFEKPIFGKPSLAVNKTNMKMLIKLHGDDETKLVGKKIKLEVIKVRNPQTGEFVSSLAVTKP